MTIPFAWITARTNFSRCNISMGTNYRPAIQFATLQKFDMVC